MFRLASGLMMMIMMMIMNNDIDDNDDGDDDDVMFRPASGRMTTGWSSWRRMR